MACPAAKSAVVIPAVRKGLCNQRVRMVQDIMLAHLFGVPAGMKSATLRQACSLPAHLYVGCRAISKIGLGCGRPSVPRAWRLQAELSRHSQWGEGGRLHTGRLSTLLRLELA